MRTDTERLNFLLQIMESEDEDAAERIQGAFMLGLKGRTALDAAMGAKLVEPGEPMPELTAIDLAVAELGRIRNVKGFSEEHDDGYGPNMLAEAAASYMLIGRKTEWNNSAAYEWWPWDQDTFKPSPDDRKRELTKGIALALCELDRLIRAERREDEAQVRTEREQESRMPEDVHVVKPAYDVRVDVFRPIEIGVQREFKVGDRVRVLSNAGDNPFGCSAGMDGLVGGEYRISKVFASSDALPTGYLVANWMLPASQLEHVDG